MYQNSTGQIKISGHVSQKFDIRKGTEQGHPLSPDLFKIYIRDLSDDLKQGNCPKLIDQIISHLLWADDLILLALDPITLQHQLDVLMNFCNEWGVEINVGKTKLIRFNSKFDLGPQQVFKIGNRHLEEVESYCYLGIEIHKSGTFTLARSELKKKALRALYGLKSTVNKSKLSFRSLTTLFDSLIKPIALYGAPIVTPFMSVLKHIVKGAAGDTSTLSRSSLPKKLSLTNCEKVHLHFLKWALGVNRKASNVGVWGESGRYPLTYESINLTLKYFNRLKEMDENTLVKLAFMEQENLKLDWYKGIEPILKIDPCFTADHVTANRNQKPANSGNIDSQGNSHPRQQTRQKEDFLLHNGFRKRIPPQTAKPAMSKRFTSHVIMKSLKNNFRETWLSEIQKSTKLEFYCTVKNNFCKEQYLDNVQNYFDRVSVTRLRISAHRLEIELGRRSKLPREERTCKYCHIKDSQVTTESEMHFLENCHAYRSPREKFISKINDIINNPEHSISSVIHAFGLTHSQEEIQKQFNRLLARFISSSFRKREKFLTSLNENS